MDNVALTAASKELGDRIIKVNHAGEHVHLASTLAMIFMARITAPALVDELIEFRFTRATALSHLRR